MTYGHLSKNYIVLRIREELDFVCLNVKLRLHVSCLNSLGSQSRDAFGNVRHNLVLLHLLIVIHATLVHAQDINVILLKNRLIFVSCTKPVFLVSNHQALVYNDRTFPKISDENPIPVVVVYFAILNHHFHWLPFKELFDFVLKYPDWHRNIRGVYDYPMLDVSIKLAIGNVDPNIGENDA